MQIKAVVYSSKAIALIGDTKAIKDEIKTAGGRFNKFLECGAGWIFSRKSVDKVNALLSKYQCPPVDLSQEPVKVEEATA